MGRNLLFPVFMKIEKLHILLVGGGNVGLEKLTALLSNCPEAKITVVAGLIREEVSAMTTTHPGVSIIQRNFEWADLEGKDLVILATDNPGLHREIKAETEKRHLMTNVADTPELCDFYLGSIVQKGDLKIGISTNGKSPTFAKRFREFLEELIPDNVQNALENLNAYRSKIKGDFEEKVQKLNDLTISVMSKK